MIFGFFNTLSYLQVAKSFHSNSIKTKVFHVNSLANLVHYSSLIICAISRWCSAFCWLIYSLSEVSTHHVYLIHGSSQSENLFALSCLFDLKNYTFLFMNHLINLLGRKVVCLNFTIYDELEPGNYSIHLRNLLKGIILSKD